MGNIAPPLEKPFFSFDGGESIKMKSIQGDNPEEARQAQRMDQALQDDSRLGLAKNQQRTQTTDTAKIQVSRMGNIDFQKIEQFPPEVYRLPEYPPQKATNPCTCFDLSTIQWGSQWNMVPPIPIPAGMVQFEIFGGQVDYYTAIDTNSCSYLKHMFSFYDLHYLNEDYSVYVNMHPSTALCTFRYEMAAPWGTIIPHKKIANSGAPLFTDILVDADDDYGFVLEASAALLAAAGVGGFDGPLYTFPSGAYTEATRGTKSPVFLWCNDEILASIPIFIAI